MAADVVIGYLHGQQVDGAFHDALVDLLMRDRSRVAGVLSMETGPVIAPARNRLAQTFLKTGAKWLLSLDADMVFPTDVVSRLARHASGTRMVGALCFAYNNISGEVWPTMYDQDMAVVRDWDAGALVPVQATGSACLMIPRTVFQRTPYPWYLTTEEMGEDQYLCTKAAEYGFSTTVDTSTVVGHAKRVVITDAHYAQK